MLWSHISPWVRPSETQREAVIILEPLCASRLRISHLTHFFGGSNCHKSLVLRSCVCTRDTQTYVIIDESKTSLNFASISWSWLQVVEFFQSSHFAAHCYSWWSPHPRRWLNVVDWQPPFLSLFRKQQKQKHIWHLISSLSPYWWVKCFVVMLWKACQKIANWIKGSFLARQRWPLGFFGGKKK